MEASRKENGGSGMAEGGGGGARGLRSGSNRIRLLLGLGYFVQGFRGFPWLSANFFMKDGLNLDPAVLQLLQNSVNLPMVAKPLYGVVSDAVYISGQHRIPYIAIGAILQGISWLAVAILSQTNASAFILALYFLLSNLGASIAEVANDAIVAESGKASSSLSFSSGELQSFVWVASSVGGVLGNLLGGIAVEKFTPQSIFLIFGLIVSLQFCITITVKESSLHLPKASSNAGIRKQLSDLSHALKKPEIAYSIAWLALSTAIVPGLTGTMFFYQTQHLKIDASVLGVSKVVGQTIMLSWGVIYNRWLKSIPPRKLMGAIQLTIAVFVLLDALFVKGFFREMGVPDSVYVLVFSGILENLFYFKNLPYSVLIARLCPPGCEGSLVAVVMSTVSLSIIVSGYLGLVLASYIGVTGDDFDAFPCGLVIEAVCVLLPLWFISWVYEETKPKMGKKEE